MAYTPKWNRAIANVVSYRTNVLFLLLKSNVHLAVLIYEELPLMKSQGEGCFLLDHTEGLRGLALSPVNAILFLFPGTKRVTSSLSLLCKCSDEFGEKRGVLITIRALILEKPVEELEG